MFSKIVINTHDLNYQKKYNKMESIDFLEILIINELMKLMDTILITGTAGFIGFHLANNLLNKGYRIIGYDGITDYYDVNLKKDRHKILKKNKNFVDIENMLENYYEALMEICKKYRPTFIIHLATQAGVRYSINNPRSYVNSNLIGTFNILELSKF